MKKLGIKEIAAATGGTAETDLYISSVFTDSRSPEKGGLFVALEGDSFDGHAFIRKAVQGGAVAVMCRKPPDIPVPFILVEDTKKAYIKLAAYYRSRLSIKLAGITGSVGKTTTKDMTALCLSSKYITHKTQGNLNNDIGVPKTLLSMDESVQAAVIEMGMNHAGEISLLSKTARPDAAIITNIGVSHIEHLGSREAILAAKLEILDGMEKGSSLIINADNDMLKSIRPDGYKTISCSVEKEADVYAHNIVSAVNGSEFDVNAFGSKAHVYLPAAGMHNIMDSLLAIGCGCALGASLEKMCSSLALYLPSGMRQRLNAVGGITFIEDCYNASPDSVRAALNVLSSMTAHRKIAVLGDMLELGSVSQKAHEDIGVMAAECKADMLFTFGEQTKSTAKAAGKAGLKETSEFLDHDKLAHALYNALKPGDAVLFKASRGMMLEKAMNTLYGLLNGNAV